MEEKHVYKNGYVEIWVEGKHVGNYDTVRQYHEEVEKEEEEKVRNREGR